MILNPIIKNSQAGEYAHIIASAPHGSTVTCDGVAGSEVPHYLDTSTWTFDIDTYGEHTVVGTYNGKTDTQTVTVLTATDYLVELELYPSELVLYDSGDECVDITGGYVVTTASMGGSLVKSSDSMTVNSGGFNDNENVSTSYLIDIPHYSSLKFDCEGYRAHANSITGFGTKSTDGTVLDYIGLGNGAGSVARSVVTLSLTQKQLCYVYLRAYGALYSSRSDGTKIKVYKIWLE